MGSPTQWCRNQRLPDTCPHPEPTRTAPAIAMPCTCGHATHGHTARMHAFGYQTIGTAHPNRHNRQEPVARTTDAAEQPQPPTHKPAELPEPQNPDPTPPITTPYYKTSFVGTQIRETAKDREQNPTRPRHASASVFVLDTSPKAVSEPAATEDCNSRRKPQGVTERPFIYINLKSISALHNR